MKKQQIVKIIIAFIVFFLLILLYLNVIKDPNDNNVDIKVEKVSSYNNPVIPEGFKKVETDSASWKLENGIPIGWNDGLVIEDENQNQFVWVPVILSDKNLLDQNEGNIEIYNESKLDKEQLEDLQIIKYEGFYVARYEAGLPNSITSNTKEFDQDSNNIEEIPVSQKESIPWNYISFDQAKHNAQKMYPDKSVVSSMITQRQWNSILNWLIKKDYNIKDSSKYGNYSNNNFTFTGYYSTDHGKTYQYSKNKIKQTYNMILSCGASDRNMTNNIYDLAGNLAEYIDNSFDDNKNQLHFVCGGYYDNISIYSISSYLGISNANSRQGFRVVLYLK